MGTQVSDLLFAELAANPNLVLVDRAELKTTLAESELNLSGMVAPGQAIQVGRLTGAKLLITGSIMEVADRIYIVAKIIGTETTRMLAASVKGSPTDDMDALVSKLAEQISGIVSEKADVLVAKPQKPEEVLAQLKKAIGDAKRPVLSIEIAEKHVGRVVPDPAAETELTMLARESGFEVVDPDTGRKNSADVVLQGQGLSEFAMRHGNLVSVKARLEVKAVSPKSGRIIATDRQTAMVVDLTEQIAGKAALQEAARRIALRLLPKIAKGK